MLFQLNQHLESIANCDSTFDSLLISSESEEFDVCNFVCEVFSRIDLQSPKKAER